MKKIVFVMLMICGALMAFSCHKEEPLKEKTYYDYLMEDYRALVAAYPEAKDNFIESLKAESVEIICYTYLQGMSEIFIFERNFETGDTQMEHYSVDIPWTGDMKIPESDMKELKFSLEDAIDNARKDPDAAASDGLDTRFITLRKPLWPV